MSTSNTGFPNPSFPIYSENNAPAEIAGSQPQGASSQGTGLGMLVLPKGEVVTILPSAPSSPQIVTPASGELASQAFASINARVILPMHILQPRNSLSFDGAIINEIKALRAEWREKKKPFDEEEDAESKKKKNKFKSGKSKKGSPSKLNTKATVHFDAEKNSSNHKPEGFSKKKTKKTSAKSIFAKAKR